MGEPAVANGVPFTLTQGASSKSSAFTVPAPKVFAAGFPVVHDQALLGGLTFVATLVTLKVTVGGRPVVLVGATVTDSAGYSGVVTPAQGAGVKFDLG